LEFISSSNNPVPNEIAKNFNAEIAEDFSRRDAFGTQSALRREVAENLIAFGLTIPALKSQCPPLEGAGGGF
jgi:hypothetical protein